MSSIMTNSAAMTALQTLQNINKNLETTQSRISTGFRVATASDNAAYWSIATTMRSDNKALSAVNDALGLGAATLDVAYTGIESAIEVTDQIKAKIVAAQQPGVDKDKIQGEVVELQNQLRSIADSANFNGENWLANDGAGTKEIVSSFTRDAAGALTVGTLTVTMADTQLLSDDNSAGALSAVMAINVSTSADLAADLTSVEDALQDMTDAATNLGAIKTRVGLQQDFVSNLMDAIDRGVGQLVDADMNEESTRLQALQTQQQLGIQALSIANSNSQNILSLFR